MKTKKITTTEFYKNPSKAVGFVMDGGTVYLGYKNLKNPVAVLTNLEVFENKKKTSSNGKSRMELLKKHQFKSKKWKSGVELQKYMRS